jgi:hypothetical protein
MAFFGVNSSRAGNNSSGGGGSSVALSSVKVPFVADGTVVTNSSSFSTISGMSATTIPVTSSQKVSFVLTADVYQPVNGASSDMEVDLYLNSTTSIVMGRHILNYFSAERQRVTMMAATTLPSGNHTVQPRWRKVQYGGSLATDVNARWNLLVIKA